MSGPYFQKQPWPAFSYQGIIYDFGHLDEYQFDVVDSAQVTRSIAVTFSDHCFTRNPIQGDDPALRYPASTRNPGHFCVERYQHSMQLVTHIEAGVIRNVGLLEHDRFAFIPTVDHQGTPREYGIIFSLDRVSGLPVKLRMQVRSAHLRLTGDMVTFGTIKFAHLVKLRMEGVQPRRIRGRRRQKP